MAEDKVTFNNMYKHLELIKQRFEEIKKLFKDNDAQVEAIKKRHNEMMQKIFDELEERDKEINALLKKKENEEVSELIEDLEHLLEEMYQERLKLMDEKGLI